MEAVECSLVRHQDAQPKVVVSGEAKTVAERRKDIDGGKEARASIRHMLDGFDLQ